jgi:hypothetical protein
MKSFYLIAAALLLAPAQGIAAPPAPVPSGGPQVIVKPVKHKTHKNPTPHCAKVRQACIAAGYFQTDPRPGKSLWRDCMAPMEAGRRVDRVQISPADRLSCSQRDKPMKSAAKSVTPATPSKPASSTKSSR